MCDDEVFVADVPLSIPLSGVRMHDDDVFVADVSLSIPLSGVGMHDDIFVADVPLSGDNVNGDNNATCSSVPDDGDVEEKTVLSSVVDNNGDSSIEDISYTLVSTYMITLVYCI
jgi:hypothetical protein